DTGSFKVQASLAGNASGLGGALATATITPNIHAPVVTNAGTIMNVQTTSGLVITPAPQDVGIVQSYWITNITGGTLYLADGVTPIASGSYITVAQGAAGLKFTPVLDSLNDGSITVRASETAGAPGIGLATVTASINVVLLGDINNDEFVDNFDIAQFELALADPVAFLAQDPARTDYALRGDINRDGYFDNFDIAGFEALMASSAASPSTSSTKPVESTAVISDPPDAEPSSA